MMKRFTLFLSLVLSSTFMVSCEKENLETITTHKLAIEIDSKKDELYCDLEECETAIKNVKMQYQAMANQSQDTIWVSITCCQDNFITEALVFVAPNNVEHKLNDSLD